MLCPCFLMWIFMMWKHRRASWRSEGTSCVPVCAPCLFCPEHHRKDSGSILFALSLQVFMYTDEMPPSPLFSRLSSTSSLSLPHRKGAPVPPLSLWSLPSMSMLPLSWGPGTGRRTPGVASPVLCGGEGSPLHLLAMLCLMQLGMLLAFVQGHPADDVCSTWCPPGHLGTFLQSCFPAGWPPARKSPWGCSSPDAGLLLVEIHGVVVSPFLQPAVPVDGSMSLRWICHSPQISVICKLMRISNRTF